MAGKRIRARVSPLYAEGVRRRKKHADRRRVMRRQWEAEGVPADEIERRIAFMQAGQQQKRDTENHLRRLNARTDDAYVQPDDSAHQPPQVDPLLKGTARATGATAKAVKQGKTMTKWQHEEAG